MISESKELELEKLFEFKIGTKNKEIIKVRLNDGEETYYKRFNAKDIKIIKDAEDEGKLDVENQEDLKELEKLEKLEEMDSKNSNDDI